MRMTPGAPWFRLSPFGAGSSGATTALDNLAAVAINATLSPGVDGAVDLGTATKEWGNLFLKSGGTINWANSDIVITHSTNLLAFSGAASGYTFDNPVIINTTAALAIGGVTALFEQFGATAPGATEALGMFNATAGTQAEFMFYRSKNASIGSATVVASGDGLGKITWYGAQQTGTFATQNPAAQIRAEVDGVVTSGAGADMPGRLIFATTPDASGTLTDRLILDSAGILKPNANDGVALGTATLMFSDLFLASGAVINWNNSDLTLTHASNLLTLAGGELILSGAGNTANSAANIDTVQTFSNKFITPQVQSVADAGGTLTPVALTNDEVVATALSQATTIANPSGSPVNGEKLIIRLKDNGTARALTWGNQYRIVGVTLPTTTVLSKYTYVGCIYNSTDTKWDVVAVSQEA